MLVIGPISSAFDFLTFYVMLVVLRADEAMFQSGWFVESLSTQVLVIFIIRTRGNPFKSRAHPVLVATSLAIAVMGALLPFTPLGPYFGFVPLPDRFYLMLTAMVVAYLAIVEVAKRVFTVGSEDLTVQSPPIWSGLAFAIGTPISKRSFFTFEAFCRIRTTSERGAKKSAISFIASNIDLIGIHSHRSENGRRLERKCRKNASSERRDNSFLGFIECRASLS